MNRSHVKRRLVVDFDISGALPLLKTVVIGGIYLSGDRPGTPKMEGWDPISKFLTGRVIWEHFTPGSFNFPGASSYNWIQFEMIFRY